MIARKRKQRNDYILVLYNRGVSYADIGKEVGLSKTGVHKVIHKLLNFEDLEDASEKKINVSSLRDIALFLEGIKHGKGNLLPLGTIVLDDLWEAIEWLNKNKP